MGTSITWLQRKKISYLRHNSQNSKGKTWNWRWSITVGFLLIFGLVWDKSYWLGNTWLVQSFKSGVWVHTFTSKGWCNINHFSGPDFLLPGDKSRIFHRRQLGKQWLKFRGQCLPALCKNKSLSGHGWRTIEKWRVFLSQEWTVGLSYRA